MNFPLPKLDMIAAPGGSQFFGAMENWGAIFYFERLLLNDPKVTTEADRQRIYLVVAHEMAHQWFGDLVTMAWWDDLWLNEGFASWMENKVMADLHPEWHQWLQALGEKQGAMVVDARGGTHPIITPIADVAQASGAFDTITYQKGAAVIRMLEAYVGESTFRAGVQRYMAAHKYGNTVTDDLWRAVDARNARPLTAIAHDFTLQAGLPLINVASTGGGYTLTASRFAVDDSGGAGGRWTIPVAIGDAGASRAATVVTGRPYVSARPLAGGLVDAGQTSYVRVAYDAPSFAGVIGHYAALPSEDQLGVLNDSYALGLGGAQPIGDFLSVATRLPLAASPVVWQTLAGDLASVDTIYGPQPSRERYRAFVRARLAPLYGRLGWDARPGEEPNVAPLRSGLLLTLAQVGDTAVIAEARRRFARLDTLSAESRQTVLTIAAVSADTATWERLHALARASRTKVEKDSYYTSLGLARDPELARRALALALADEVEPTLRPAIIGAVAANNPELAFDFTAAHWAVISPLLEPTSQARFAPRLAAGSGDAAILPRLDAFAAAHIAPTARKDTAQAAATIRATAKARAQAVPGIDAWLAAHPAG